MAASELKIAIFEKDGQELSEPTEYKFSMDDLPFQEPSDSIAVTESGGLPTSITIYRTATQTVGNRKALCTIAYDGGGKPTSETWQYFEDDGTTVKKTITLTHTYSGDDLVSTVQAVT